MTERFDLYRDIHKGLRRTLGNFAARAGATDWSDPAEVERLTAEWQTVAMLLHTHHDHEEQFVHPLLAQSSPGSQRPFEADHAAQQVMLADLEAHFQRLSQGETAPECRPALGLEFYRAFSLFLADYLPHLHREETEAQRILETTNTPAELQAVEGAIIASIPPDQMMHEIDCMFPAMNLPERAALLGGVKAGAPPEVFAVLSERVRQAVGDEDWSRLAAALAL